MIKINLLGEGRPRVSKPKKTAAASSIAGEPAVLWMLILLAVGLLVIAGQYFRLQSTISQKAEEITRVQQEVDELKPIIEEVEHFEARKAELEHKISVINTLKDNQRGPVRIMDEVSRALPEMLWLTRMQAQGNSILLQGQAFNTNAVANFLDNLDQVDAFAEPVLRETVQRRGRGSASEIFNFSVSFGFDAAAARTAATPEPETDAAG